MHRSNGIDSDRVWVWMGVVIAHLLVCWLLTRPYERDIRADSDGLDVVWIESSPPAVSTPRPARSTSRPARSTPAIVPAPDAAPMRGAAPSASVATAEAERAPSLSAVFLEQGQAWAKAQHPPGDFARNPLARQSPTPAEARGDRFVMQEERSPQDVVAGIGTLFGGGGDLVDCARIRDTITNLATGGAGERLEEELRRNRRLCR